NGDHPALHSFPTRRSSDLALWSVSSIAERTSTRSPPSPSAWTRPHSMRTLAFADTPERGVLCWYAARCLISVARFSAESPDAIRSEEHTSELQSPCNLVCR